MLAPASLERIAGSLTLAKLKERLSELPKTTPRWTPKTGH